MRRRSGRGVLRFSAMWTVLLFLAAVESPVSFHREVAAVLAFACNRCHGDQGAAGGLDTRTYRSLLLGGTLGPAVIPGDVERSPLLVFVEGRRGREHRMPLGEAPLPASEIGVLRRWIAGGAQEDANAAQPVSLRTRRVRVRRGERLTIKAESPSRAYLEVLLTGSGGKRFLHREAAPTRGGRLSWTLQVERGWPRTIDVELRIAYADRYPAGSRLSVRVAERAPVTNHLPPR